MKNLLGVKPAGVSRYDLTGVFAKKNEPRSVVLAHHYFREFSYADSGMIALLQCLELFSDANKPVSEVIAPVDTRCRSGEINSTVTDIPAKLAELQRRYAGATIDHLDGVTIAYPDWWMNVRPSNTEPLLRLNVEGDTKELMERHRDEALALIRT